MKIIDPRDLLNCYANGVFPMSDARDTDDVFLVDPELRGIFDLGSVKISKSLAKTVRNGNFQIKTNTAFDQVVDACAAPRPGHPDTWINEVIFNSYLRLHEMGHAHCVECWQGNTLVGGLYGVSLGAAFFGESMFSHANNASKTALVHLEGRLLAGGFKLLDTQFMTEHLRTLGAIEISRTAYKNRLELALQGEGDFSAPGFDDSAYAQSVLQRSSPVSGTKQSSTHIS